MTENGCNECEWDLSTRFLESFIKGMPDSPFAEALALEVLDLRMEIRHIIEKLMVLSWVEAMTLDKEYGHLAQLKGPKKRG